MNTFLKGLEFLALQQFSYFFLGQVDKIFKYPVARIQIKQFPYIFCNRLLKTNILVL